MIARSIYLFPSRNLITAEIITHLYTPCQWRAVTFTQRQAEMTSVVLPVSTPPGRLHLSALHPG